MEYIHYGAKHFDREKFRPIQNQCFIKPRGGFWASPVDVEYGWKQWCCRENFRECDEENSFRFRLTENARVLHIRNLDDAEALPSEVITGSRFMFPDFEKIQQNYDAIEFHLSECWELYHVLYGWDCDSILIMNPDIIVEKRSE